MKATKPHLSMKSGHWRVTWMDWYPSFYTHMSRKTKWSWEEHETVAYSTIAEAWDNYMRWIR